MARMSLKFSFIYGNVKELETWLQDTFGITISQSVSFNHGKICEIVGLRYIRGAVKTEKILAAIISQTFVKWETAHIELVKNGRTYFVQQECWDRTGFHRRIQTRWFLEVNGLKLRHRITGPFYHLVNYDGTVVTGYAVEGQMINDTNKIVDDKTAIEYIIRHPDRLEAIKKLVFGGALQVSKTFSENLSIAN